MEFPSLFEIEKKISNMYVKEIGHQAWSATTQPRSEMRADFLWSESTGKF